MQYPQWAAWGPQQDEDLPTSCLSMLMNMIFGAFFVILIVSVLLMGVDWLFGTSFASDFISWVGTKIEGIGS